MAVALLAVGLAVPALLLPGSAGAQQPLPIRELAYSAKFLCGFGATGDFSLPREVGEMTVIEVHNPHPIPVTVTIKWVLDYPAPQVVIGPYPVTLQPNEALNLDCEDLYFPGCPPVCGDAFRGFVEIRTPQQLKVVALYKEVTGQGAMVGASVAKNSLLPFFLGGFVAHSGAFMVGNTAAASGDTVRHETTITLTNVSNNLVNANVSIVSPTGMVTNFPRLIQPSGFTHVTAADLPLATPLPFVGSVIVKYADMGFGALLACEEILQKHLISGPRGLHLAMSVVEVQPIPLRTQP